MVRKAQAGDAGAIKTICEEALGHHTTEEHIEKRICELGGDSHYYIAVFEDEADNFVKGFLQAEEYSLLYGGRGWNIIALAVDEKFRLQGIGKALLRSLEEYASEENCDFIRLNSRIEREKAHGFYEHLGYRCDKTQKRFIKQLANDRLSKGYVL